jgi:hypothetical protein
MVLPSAYRLVSPDLTGASGRALLNRFAVTPTDKFFSVPNTALVSRSSEVNQSADGSLPRSWAMNIR